MEQVKDAARAEIAQAKQAGQEEQLKNALLQELQNTIIAAEQVKQTVREVERSQLIGQDKSSLLFQPEVVNAARNATKAVIRVLQAVKEGIITPPAKSKIMFNQLAERGIGNEYIAPSLHTFLERYLNKDISFSESGQSETQFETDIDRLKTEDGGALTVLRESLVPVAEEFGLSKDEMREKFKIPRERIGEREGPYEAQELARLMGRYPPEDHELLRALYLEDEFEPYMEKLHREIREDLESRGEGVGLTEEKFGEKIGGELSTELKKRITMLVGKLYQKTDESSPEEFWEKKEQEGGLLYSVQIQLDSLRRQIDRLGKISISKGSILGRIKFYREEDEKFDLNVPTDKGEEVRHFVKPFRKQVKSNFQEYFLTVYNTVNDEINDRKFLHNARALPYHPPGEGGYYGQLANYAEELLPSSSIDILTHLPDSSETLAASQLWDKLYEADFAKYNWLHQPSRGALDAELKLTPNDIETLDYLKLLNPDLEKDKWRAMRALIMAIGDNYSISLRALETGAYADAPLNIEKEGGATYASYDKRDSAIFKVFNPLAHENLRWQVEMLRWGNLLFLPVSGKKLGRAGAWNHRELMSEMKKNMREYLEGRTAEDEKNGVVRFVNLINPGKVGSIYTRGSWRNFYTYEGFLVHEESDTERGIRRGDRVDALTGWKRVENIGIEILKDYFPRIGELYSKNFYAVKVEDVTGVDKKDPEFEKKTRDIIDALKSERATFITYLYKKYIDPLATDDKIKKQIVSLEADPDKLKDNYTDFYWRVLSNALLQRAPTKLIRLERNRFVSGRKRGWEEVRQQARLRVGETDRMLTVDEFDEAVKDICAAEVLLRKEITAKLKKGIEQGKSLDEISDELSNKEAKDKSSIDYRGYNLTEKVLRNYLDDKIKPRKPGSDEVDTERIERAIAVYEKIIEFNRGVEEKDKNKKHPPTRTDNFAQKYKDGGFPFAIAVEELERSFLAHKGAGERVPARALGDINAVEKNVANSILQLFTTIRQASIDGKKDFSEIVKLIGKAQEQVDVLQGREPSQKLAHHMAAVAISFFKKDTAARGLLGIIGTGKRNSIAAEFAGRSSAVWQWESKEIDAFCTALETAHILPKPPYEIQKPPTFEPIVWKIPLLGKDVKLPLKRRKPDYIWNGTKLRKEFGGDWKSKTFDLVNQYVPIALAILLFYYLQKAYKEWFEKQK